MSDWLEKIKAEMHWWPPKVGDILRKHERFVDHSRDNEPGEGIPIKNVAAKVHVLALFEHDGETWIVTALWLPSRRRWKREIYGMIEASGGALWRDSDPVPEMWRDRIKEIDVST